MMKASDKGQNVNKVNKIWLCFTNLTL